MILLVGLGNPTPDSNDNRHNVGFKIIDAINQKFGLSIIQEYVLESFWNILK